LLAAGFASHREWLDWRLVIAVAIVGGTMGDQIAFLLGRWKGQALIDRLPAVARRAPRVRQLLYRYHAPFILVNRFLYGLRIAGPIVVGTCEITYLRFAIFNVIGAIIWAPTIVGLGYFFGAAINSVSREVRDAEIAIVLTAIAIGFAIFWWRKRK
jgi:membrane protein DedA with SNARE-associated domain